MWTKIFSECDMRKGFSFLFFFNYLDSLYLLSTQLTKTHCGMTETKEVKPKKGWSNPALRMMGIPRISLPSRNWMIFGLLYQRLVVHMLMIDTNKTNQKEMDGSSSALW